MQLQISKIFLKFAFTMSVILNIETSSKICSVAIGIDGHVEFHIESDEPMQHAAQLGVYVEKALEDIHRRELALDAVAVSIGPGSYTGLRIGLSLAKGLCFSKDIPLIGIPTLELMAVKAMFSLKESEGDEILVSMIDAGRMEVYTAAYDFRLNKIIPATPLIIKNGSYDQLKDYRKAIFFGDGMPKSRNMVKLPNKQFLNDKMPVALDMAPLSEKYFRERKFMDVAYGVPLYLKEYQAKISKNKVIG